MITKADGVPRYVSEKEGTNFLIKLKELAILYVKSGDFMIFPTECSGPNCYSQMCSARSLEKHLGLRILALVIVTIRQACV